MMRCRIMRQFHSNYFHFIVKPAVRPLFLTDNMRGRYHTISGYEILISNFITFDIIQFIDYRSPFPKITFPLDPLKRLPGRFAGFNKSCYKMPFPHI